MRARELLRSHEGELSALLERRYGLTGTWSALPGEVDANLRLKTGRAGAVIVKVTPAGEGVERAAARVDLQVAIFDHLDDAQLPFAVPKVQRSLSGDARLIVPCADGDSVLWVCRWMDGEVLAERGHASPELCRDLGRSLGELDRALLTFSHEGTRRPDFKWDLCRAGWIGSHLDALCDDAVRSAVEDVCDRFVRRVQLCLGDVPRSVVHNDANDHNLLVAYRDGREILAGVLDFGDLCETIRVAEVAIAASYAAMLSDDPLAAIDAVVSGYDSVLTLSEKERELVVPLVETRLAVSLVNSAIEVLDRPDDPYVTVSQAGARRLLLELNGRSHAVASVRLARACGATPSRHAPVREHLEANRGRFEPVLDCGSPLEEAPVLDLSFESLLVGDDVLRLDATKMARHVEDVMREVHASCAIGRYSEPRPIYTDVAFGFDEPTARRRTVHMGIDVFAPAGTWVRSPAAGRVVDVRVCEGHLDYGGLVVLEHGTPDGVMFCTLHGHLDPASISGLRPGDELTPGQRFAQLGSVQVNGGWPPHLHLQVLAHSAEDLEGVPWGVVNPDDLGAHLEVFPDPSPLVGGRLEQTVWRAGPDLSSTRTDHLAANLATSYSEPLALVRGWRHILFDRDGRRYLDAYNNVPHVGHGHPAVVEAVARQTALLATNTRYLHYGIQRYAERLCALLPKELSVAFFTPSGSEANELAIRLVRQYTGRRDMCVMDHGYHGHTNAAMALSPYKFRQEGAPPQPEWVHVTAQPDVYRGSYRGNRAGALFAADVTATVESLVAEGRAPAGYLCECLPSVGGQLELPAGFLATVYDAVRRAGGLCVADDVQTALWRTGDHAFGFERHGVVPDILVLGKPLGNGFPIGAVVTTPEVAQAFSRGPEFFSTFGGSAVAMAAGLAVLDVLEQERLAENAQRVGALLVQELRGLAQRHESIGDVRGRGFFIGVELVRDADPAKPASELARRVKNRLRQRRVLIGTDGPDDNVLKIRPPMTFDENAASCVLGELDQALRMCSRTG